MIPFSTLLLIGCTSSHVSKSISTTHEMPRVPYQNIQVQNVQIEGSDSSPTQHQVIERAEATFLKSLDSRNERTVMSTLQALALCHHPIATHVLSKYVLHESPFLQLASLRALSILNTEKSIASIHECLKSDYPLVRLEAAWLLIEAQEPGILNQIFALNDKLPQELTIFLPELYAKEGSKEALDRLRKMTYEENDQVVCQVFLSLYKYKHINCEEWIITYQTHSPIVLEAIATLLGLFASDSSLIRLQTLSNHENCFVRVRALLSRLMLGDNSIEPLIQKEYENDPQLITDALISVRESTFIPKFTSYITDRDCNIGSIIYRTLCRDDTVTASIISLLVPEKGFREGLFFIPSLSPGGTIITWQKKIEPPFSSFDQKLYAYEQSIEFQEAILNTASTHLLETSFVQILEAIAIRKKTDLYPSLFFFLQELSLEQFSLFYNQFRNRLGAPYLRAYLALAKMKRDQVFDEAVIKECFQVAHKKLVQKESWRISIPFITNQVPSQFQGDDSSPPLEAAQRLYLLACQISLELAQSRSIQVMYEELNNCPIELAPFIAAALLEASL